MARLLVDEHRTMDPAKATSFIVPFDIGVHSFLDHRTGKVRVASPHGWRAIEYFKQTASQHVFNKNNFHDHFILVSAQPITILITFNAIISLVFSDFLSDQWDRL